MAKKTKRSRSNSEPDSVYVLKLILYFIVGSLWLQLDSVSIAGSDSAAFPIGLVVGAVFASHDHFQIDRKIEYAVLLAAAVISFFAPTGFVLVI